MFGTFFWIPKIHYERRPRIHSAPSPQEAPMTRGLIGLLITLALLVAPLGAEAPPPGKISPMGSRTPESGVADDELAGPSTVRRDWRGLGRDTAFFVGYEA